VASPRLCGKLQNLPLLKVSKEVVMSFCVAGAVLDDIRKCLKNRQSSFSVSAAILLQCFHDLWQAQHFGDVQHFGRIVLRAFCGSHCQGCVKW